MNPFTLITAIAAILPFATASPMLGLPKPEPSSGSMSVMSGTVVKDNYIILLKKNTTDEEFQAHQTWATSLHINRLTRRDDASLTGIKFQYHFGILSGYSGAFDSETIASIRARDDVEMVEEDKVMVAQELITQEDATWGISRISQKTPFNGKLPSTYTYDSSAGEGITAYVIDTGINLSHEEFEGRAEFGMSAVGGEDDDQGHGTHVAGTIASKTYGVAKKANLVAVKVLGGASGSGSTSGVIAGVDWVVKDAKAKGRIGKSVVNMSLGGEFTTALNRAVDAAINAGIPFAVAAGNDFGQDASQYSPASVKNAITVGAMDSDDTRADYSNIGSLVDVFAPGTQITSTWIGSNVAINTISGTSMASPHVAGLAAYLMALEGLTTPAEVTARIKQLAIDGVVQKPARNTVDALVFNGVGAGKNVTDPVVPNPGRGNGTLPIPRGPRRGPSFVRAVL
ncbi:oryzin precursor [Pyronema omphalodes]|nr:oryzin precursor [Pyronema omphalodes]